MARMDMGTFRKGVRSQHSHPRPLVGLNNRRIHSSSSKQNPHVLSTGLLLLAPRGSPALIRDYAEVAQIRSCVTGSRISGRAADRVRLVSFKALSQRLSHFDPRFSIGSLAVPGDLSSTLPLTSRQPCFSTSYVEHLLKRAYGWGLPLGIG